MKRLSCIVSGEVQGVGFRAWTRNLAADFDLAGWVMNKEDGTVELVAEGDDEALKEFLKKLSEGPDTAWVEHVESTWSTPTDEFDDFEIRS